MRGYRTIIQEAELLAMSAEAAAAFLKNRAESGLKVFDDDPVDSDTETSLLSRNETLVTLSVARYSRHGKVVGSLFSAHEPGSAIRLACLANEAWIESSLFYMDTLFGGENETAEWIVSADHEELYALLQNSKLPDSLLTNVLERKNPFDRISEERLLYIVKFLTGNRRLKQVYDDSYMDGYADFSFHSVFNAAWKLAAKVSVNETWAWVLHMLYHGLSTKAYSVEKPLDIAVRWHPDSSDRDAMARVEKAVQEGTLSAYEEVRKGLARLALAHDATLLEQLLSSDDRAFRAAAYVGGTLTSTQLLDAYSKDGKLVFDEALHNESLWKSRNGREALRQIAWTIVDDDKYSDLFAANIYNGVRDDKAKEHPEWFKDDDPDTLPRATSSEPATKADISRLSDELARRDPGITLQPMTAKLELMYSRMGWVWWVSLGALIASIAHP